MKNNPEEHVTVTTTLSLTVTDPAAVRAWAAADLDRDGRGLSRSKRDAMITQVLADTTAAVHWAYVSDPDDFPPSIRLSSGNVTVIRVNAPAVPTPPG